MSFVERLDQVATLYGFNRQVLSSEGDHPTAALARGLARLQSQDASLLNAGTAERAICHRLAQYIEEELSSDTRKQYVVDVEYNRVGSATPAARCRGTTTKSVYVRGVRRIGGRWVPEDAPGFHPVSPDIIVHRRDSAHNVLVLEAKSFFRPRQWDEELVAYDFRKLLSYQESDQKLKYRTAVFLAILPEFSQAPNGSSVAVYVREVPGQERI